MEPRRRRSGARLVEGALDAELAARGLEARDLCKLARMDKKTISAARAGGRISRNSLMKLTDALLKVPVRPLAARLVGAQVEKRSKAVA